jgi:membrane glycosyltransferase
MDGQLTPPVQRPADTEPFNSTVGAMPLESPLDMPVQARERAPAVSRPQQPLRTWFARALAMTTTIAIGTYAITEMVAIVGFSNMTNLQAAMIVFFAITLLWIAFAAGSAVCAVLAPPMRFATSAIEGSRTALLMPVYNEDPVRTTASLQAMAEELGQAGVAQHFEIVIISDSTNADAWIAESLAVERLRAGLKNVMPVRYRRRWHNVGRKVGNVEDFVKRWGGHYDYMIVLDADSLMSPATLVTLVERMQGDSQIGILQTVPALIGQTSLFARMQQFASFVYGSIVARGLAAWSGDDGNYWGHNAIIRVRAFAQACGLPHLPGRKPFGGFVLSHDFIEAAYIRRAGWKVCVAADLRGSWEEGPPSLTDMAVRDRRWAQGNLQHVKLIGSAGLTWTSRLHIAVGIMSYVASPLWLFLILIGFALTLQATLIRPEYFSKTFQLFPDWPVFDARRMMMLFMFSMMVLLLPKAIGLVRGMLVSRVRRNSGGFIGLPVSVTIELILSALYAPVMMLVQTQHVISILTGSDSEWNAQRRQAEVISWREATHFHWKHMVIGALTGVIAFLLSPTLLAWLSPTVAGLLLAIPLSKASGSVRLGQVFARLHLMRIPEEVAPPALMQRREDLIHAAEPTPAEGLLYLARHPQARLAHIAGNLPRPADERGHPNAHRLTAHEKLSQAQSLREALDWLTAPERIEVAADAALLEQLAQLPQVEAVG